MQLELVSEFRNPLREWLETVLPGANATDKEYAKVISQLGGMELSGYDASLIRPAGFPEAMLLRLNIHLPVGKESAAYLYVFRNGKWLRILAAEPRQDQLRQSIDTVVVSMPDPQGSRLLAVVGRPVVESGCLHSKDAIAASQLVKGHLFADICSSAEQVTLEPNGVSIEYVALTRRGERRPGVLHLRFRGDKPERTSPLALKPEDFLDEWLQLPWAEASRWVEAKNVQVIEAVHREGYGKLAPMASYNPATRCGSQGLWQVVESADGTTQRYYLIRESGDHDYRVVDVSEASHPFCQQ